MGIRLGGAFALLLAGIAVLVALAPGGLGDPDPIVVSDGPSVVVYGWLAGAVPHEVAENGAAAGLLVLGGLHVLTLWRGRSERRAVTGVVLSLVATVAAYAVSEALKLVVDEERPCRGLLADCPAPGDWSFPSNHATLAAALAVGLVLVRPRLGAIALAVAVAVGVLRVVASVHYPHDVLAGWALGATAAVVVLALVPPALDGRERRGDPVTSGPPRAQPPPRPRGSAPGARPGSS